MEQLPISVVIVVALLTIFLSFVLAIRYIVYDEFNRTRLMMTALVVFIAATLTVSFYRYTFDTLPFTIPSCIVGMTVGYFVGVRTAERKLAVEGIAHYMGHFAHIHLYDLRNLSWWSFLNFYSVVGGLLMINLIGLSNVIFGGNEQWATITSIFGAFGIGTIVPYLLHLWNIRTR